MADDWDQDYDQLPQQTSGLSLNPNASEWKPNTGAKEFVPSWMGSGAGVPRPAPPAAPSSNGPAKVLSIGGGSAPAKAVSISIGSTPKPQEKPAANGVAEVKSESQAEAARPESPKPAKTASPAPSASKEQKKAEAKAEAKAVAAQEAVKESVDVQADIEKLVDDEVVTDLFGKEHLNVVFMGHVDAGKSTMGGNILFLTGMVDKRTMEKYEKDAKEAGRESWYLSWALDTNTEERAKGKTVECGRASFETEKRRYTILDAPGHKNYVPSMITGASQADIGVLVISARKGEFETGFERGGQTQEHAVLAKTSGVGKLIVAINKMDDATVNWNKERYDEIVSKLTRFLKGLGYNPKTDLQFMPVSGFTGANIKDRYTELDWYDGPSLLEYLDNMQALERKINAPLMMPITEKYKDMGTIVVGKLESGAVKKGQNVIIMPNKKVCEVTAVYGESEEEIPAGLCGDNVRMRLRGIEEEEVSVGFVLCSPKAPVKTTTAFECQLAILEAKNIICPGYTAILHVHSAVEEITISAFLHLIDKKTGRRTKRPPQFVKQGQKVICRIETAGPLCVEPFDDHPQLGRFTLRDEGKTIAIGKITKVYENESA
ncbi:hypothetical protein BZG36_03841 [Bifiguratus adelaidae]|uniref:Eukaryotic peptide chain release factor GTP-binding subunit n=1 Tax=Bifiguratus adelaidae TaxID=1938954 RepID=A0A261XWA4_9FUNG|nr:hypothetical protein BZG36_03841 [Bifiguratus adelaidae]